LVILIAFAAAAALVGAEPETVVQAATEQSGRAKATRAQREACYLLATGAADLDLADCLSFAEAPGPQFRAEVCNFLRETGQLEDFNLTSYSQCVRHGFER
jgi:hypothetical protein